MWFRRTRRPASAVPPVLLLSTIVLLLPAGLRCESSETSIPSTSEDFSLYSTAEETVAFDNKTLKVWRPVQWDPLPADDCAPCENHFNRLEDDAHGWKARSIYLQERGEPKSGTGLIFEWAMSALAHSCKHLESAYGRGSCRIEWDFFNRTLIFEPSQATKDARGPCRCESVRRVVVSMSNDKKHALPVAEDCAWAHGRGMSVHDLTEGRLCRKMGDAPIKGEAELWRCMQEARCAIVDDRQQMAVLRDPRAIAVSSYFHAVKVGHASNFRSLDDFVLSFLPIASKWIVVRHLLFQGMLAERSHVYWVEDARSDPMGWHYEFLHSVGLSMPASVVHEATRRSVLGGRILGFPSKGVDPHEGGRAATPERSWEDEVLPSTLLKMNHVLRAWLPPVLLAKLRVPP